MIHLRRWFPFIVLTLIVLTLDQLSKALVIASLPLGGSWTPIPALEAIFRITHSTNSGAAFSMFQGNNLPLLLLSVIMAVGIVVYFVRTTPAERPQRIALAILLGGVLGNLVDRLHYGTVIDFIHWTLPGVISNVSNLADHAIVLSILILFVAGRTQTKYHTAHEDPASDAPNPTAAPPAQPRPANGVRDPGTRS